MENGKFNQLKIKSLNSNDSNDYTQIQTHNLYPKNNRIIANYFKI